jgi:radical SAM superfamily enzyme YgiQ (UPF0313 family)
MDKNITGKYNILLIAPKYKGNSDVKFHKKNYDYFFPMGLCYVSAALKKAGYTNIYGLNLNHFDKTTTEALNEELDKRKYDLVLTGNNAMGYDATKLIFNTLRAHSSKPKIIFGGPMITSEPEVVFEDLLPDFGVIGEGEETIVELVKCLETDGDIIKVNGLIYKNGNETIMNERRKPIKDINTIPFPDMELFGFDEFLDNHYCNEGILMSLHDYPRFYPILGSRDCPFHCTFCYHYDNLYRARSLDNIMEEIEYALKKYKINGLQIYDECFAVNKERLVEFCRRIKELSKKYSTDIKWFPELRVGILDRDALRMMKDSGCCIIGYGFESMNKDVLKSMNKGITPEQIDKSMRDTMEEKIAIQACFLFGDVAETTESAYETLNYWKKNCKGQVNLNFVEPYPNSKLYQHCLKKGIIKDKMAFIKDLIRFGDLNYNMTDNMTDEELKKFDKDRLAAVAKYKKYIMPVSIKRIDDDIYEVNAKCPFCNEIITYKHCHIKNKFSYSFLVMCRKCGMRFYIANSLRKFVYEHYDKFKKLRNLQLKTMAFIRKRKL